MEYIDNSFFDNARLRSLRIQQLYLVQEIVRHGSLAAAAASTNMTQSAVTKNLQSLESTLGVRLFERSRAGLKSTLVTERFVLSCNRILTELARSVVDMESLVEGQQGRIRVGVLLAATPILLPKVLAAMGSSHPRIGVEIVEGTLAVLSPLLATSDIDIILGRLDVRADSSPFQQHILYEDEVVLVVRNSHPLNKKRRLSLGQLSQENWIFPSPGTSLREELDSAFKAEGITPPDSKIESVALSTNLSLVAQMDCIVALPKQVYLAHKKQHGINRLSVSLDRIPSRVGYALRVGSHPNPAVLAFIEALKAAALSISGTVGD